MTPQPQDPDALTRYADAIRANGPTRVMIDPDEAKSPRRAKNEHGIEPAIIFIRNDGWSLGAPRHLERYAEALYQDTWIGTLENTPDGWEVCPYTRP